MIRNVAGMVLLAATLLFNATAYSRVTLRTIWGDNIVIQQNSEILISGTANRASKVVVTASWNPGKRVVVYADKDGSFQAKLLTPKGSQQYYQVCFDDGETLCLNNILVGDVWFCSGQSNMEMPVKGFRGQPVTGSLDAIVTAKATRSIRLFTVKNAWSTTPAFNSVEGKWSAAGPEAVADFSAAAYFFANKLNQVVDIPIGIINCSWSMSKIEAWMSREMLAGFPAIAMPDPEQKEFGWTAGTPTLLFNAMVQPWQGFPVRGMLWYQGEANTGNPQLYKKLFPEMLKGYRAFFHQQQMPFYFVQLAPWKSDHKDSLDWAQFRQVQLELSQELTHVGMVHTVDLGDEVFIHPPRKKEVGERLALWALADAYGVKGFTPTGPVFQSASVKDGAVEVTFKYGEFGLNPENAPVEGFEIAGSDGHFLPAQAVVINATAVVKVWNEAVSMPVQVRYCFRNYKTGNLVNNFALPAAPFSYTLTK
ncbi:hypothetical protein FPE01S_03_01160 [Flavihumibacter petaseus NBRC 106054]|uniref:Sialate O-acetylesterase domain-containing protein n=2 Tax=Flavihumibacter TaxID=1004301 RepID=A0A0E9N331_9BACT|nr:hypothetical protein FPE01S_03_01160 [Flavihumibacter petaseus NBRC 106054]